MRLVSGITFLLLIGCICYEATGNVGSPQKKKCCGVNQEWRDCGTYWYCEPTCQRPGGQACPRICVEGCFCKTDYIRKRTNGTCILKDNCNGGC